MVPSVSSALDSTLEWVMRRGLDISWSQKIRQERRERKPYLRAKKGAWDWALMELEITLGVNLLRKLYRRRGLDLPWSPKERERGVGFVPPWSWRRVVGLAPARS